MLKTLKVVNQDKCTGCEMCVLESQLQLKTAGLEGSYIRVFRDLNNGTKFVVSIDPKIGELNLKRIMKSCPKDNIVEAEEDGA